MRNSARAVPFLASLFISGLASAAPVAWQIDPAHSAAHFSIRHMMVSNVRGDFSKLGGTLQVDDADLAKSSVEATIDVGTVSTREPGRDKHLRSPDFFDVAKFPTMTFKSTSVKKKGKNRLTVMGDLTMHGVTKPVTLDVEISPEVKDPMGGKGRRGIQATTKLHRKDFGVSYNKALEAGGMALGDDVEVTLDIEVTRAAGAEGVAK
jgi:polyisoprenoid-binding protein YceI